MGHGVTMTMTMAMTTMTVSMPAFGERRTAQCETGRDDQRRGERKSLHPLLHGGERICPLNQPTTQR
jgi:hypothetical protein